MRKSTIFARLSKNTIYLLLGNIGGTGLAFLFSILIGRFLGEAGLGVYSAVLAWVFSLSMLVDFGISSLITRELAAHPEKTAIYLNTALKQRWIFSFIFGLLLLFFAPFLSNEDLVVKGLQISVPLLLVENLFGTYTAIFRAQERMLPIALLNLGMVIIQLLIAYLALVNGADILSVLLINLMTSTGRLLIGWLFFRNTRPVKRSQEGDFSLRKMLALAMPFALAGLLAVAQQRLGILMLEMLSSLEELGRYAAVMRFVDAGRLIPNALFAALFPVLANLAADKVTLNRLFIRVGIGLLIFSTLLALFATVFAADILRLSYGDSFLSAGVIFKFAIWSLVPSLIRAARTLYHYANGRETFVNYVLGLSLVLQFLLSLWLIPLLGALGLVLAMLIAEVISLLLLR